jgi:uncharacterized membrane protein
MSKRENGAQIGLVAGSLLFMHFTLIFSPGKWLFTELNHGAALILFADIAMLFVALCGLTGYLIGKYLEKRNDTNTSAN